jgi:hypothetical protein
MKIKSDISRPDPQINTFSLKIQQESIGRIWNNKSEDLYEV